MMTNKIILFRASYRSLTGLLIAGVTNCPFSHAAVYCADNDEIYHASESTGGFFPMTQPERQAYAKRRVTVLEFAGDLRQWVEHMNGRDYDWPGVLLWVLQHHGDPERVYCFEAARWALWWTGVAADAHGPVSGCDLEACFSEAKTGRFSDFFMREQDG